MDERVIGPSSPWRFVLTDSDALDVQNGSSCPVCQSVEEISSQNVIAML